MMKNMKDDRNLLIRVTANICLIFDLLVILCLTVGWFQGEGSPLVRPVQIGFSIGYLGMGMAFLLLVFLSGIRLFRMMLEAMNRNDITKDRTMLSDQGGKFPLFRVTLSCVLFVVVYFFVNLLMRAGA